MANSNLIIKFKLWDYWIEDPIDRGSKPIILNVIYEIENNNKLYLIQRELNNDN